MFFPDYYEKNILIIGGNKSGKTMFCLDILDSLKEKCGKVYISTKQKNDSALSNVMQNQLLFSKELEVDIIDEELYDTLIYNISYQKTASKELLQKAWNQPNKTHILITNNPSNVSEFILNNVNYVVYLRGEGNPNLNEKIEEILNDKFKCNLKEYDTLPYEALVINNADSDVETIKVDIEPLIKDNFKVMNKSLTEDDTEGDGDDTEDDGDDTEDGETTTEDGETTTEDGETTTEGDGDETEVTNKPPQRTYKTPRGRLPTRKDDEMASVDLESSNDGIDTLEEDEQTEQEEEPLTNITINIGNINVQSGAVVNFYYK